jgi:PAS domain S-box-containing protein
MARERKKSASKLKIHLWRIALVTVLCSLLYYLPVFSGFIGGPQVQVVLNQLHDFYGLDIYALIFFGPVVYAAYVLGVGWAVVTALVCMLVLVPYSIIAAQYPSTLFRPAAFGIILSAVGAAIAMLQKGDEQRRRNLREITCLHEIGQAAEESSSIERFMASLIRIIPQAFSYPEKIKVRMVVREKTYQSPDFEAIPNSVTETLAVRDETLGTLEIYGSYRHPLKDYSPLLKAIAKRISGAIHEIEMEQSLESYYRQLEEMVDDRTKDLQKAQDQLRLLSYTVKSSIDGITLADMDGNLTFGNEASQKMWGYSPEELAGMKTRQLYAENEREKVTGEIIPSARKGSWTGELSALRKDGREFPVMVTISPVYTDSGEMAAIVGVYRDVTETKEMRDKLIRSERLAAVGELASGVGHELRNPLNVIRNCVYLINMSLAEGTDPEIAKTLRLLDQQVDISNKIVTDLLNFTRIRPPALASVDLNSLVKESLSWVSVPQEVQVTTEFDSKSPNANIDGEQVGRVFANIISNAVQAMMGKGKLNITTGTENGHVKVSFEDNGCGIPEKNLERIFEPLFTTKPKGIGLGLAISKRLVEQNHGRIEVASQVGAGTTFTVKIPAYKKES